MSAPIDAALPRIIADLDEPPPPGLSPLIEALQQRYGDALRAIVLYGSCRRNADLGNGLVDLMAVVRGYRAAHGRSPGGLLSAAFNAALPPNVYYLEAGPDQARIRCKYIVVSEATLRRRTAGGLDGYFWARFTQPCRLVHRADDAAAHRVARCRAAAAAHFASEAGTLGNAELDARAFWIRAVRATYGCELRPEPPGSATTLIDRDPEFWAGLSAALLPALEGFEAIDDDRYRIRIRRARRLAGRLRWALRRAWSKTLNVLRLFKAAGTFSNGIEYLVWKIERHSGIRIEPTERMRRWPRISGLALLFRLWRNGAFR